MPGSCEVSPAACSMNGPKCLDLSPSRSDMNAIRHIFKTLDRGKHTRTRTRTRTTHAHTQTHKTHAQHTRIGDLQGLRWTFWNVLDLGPATSIHVTK